MLPDQPPQKEKYSENPRVLEELNKGKFCIDKFWGQTHFYVSQATVDLVGKDSIIRMIHEIYSDEELRRVVWEVNDYEHSVLFVLPPQRMSETQGFIRDESDQRIETLVTKIESVAK